MAILSTFILFNVVHAEECKQVCVAKSFYNQGQAVVISGKVDAVLENTPLLIQVFRDSNRVHIAQVDVAKDGTYTYSLIADGPYFKTDGKYTVQASYGVTGNVYETSFDFQTKQSSLTTPEIFEVRSGDGSTFDIPYTIRGGTVKNIVVDPTILGLVVTIQADKDGSLTLDLGREWIDAKKSDGTDDAYIIRIDDSQIVHEESPDKQGSRKITIPFQEGDSNIQIIGTYVIPEFGSLVSIILISAVISTIVILKNSLLRFN